MSMKVETTYPETKSRHGEMGNAGVQPIRPEAANTLQEYEKCLNSSKKTHINKKAPGTNQVLFYSSAVGAAKHNGKNELQR